MLDGPVAPGGQAGDGMTVPDGDLGDVLRRQLSAAVDAVEPGANGLERIRARTGKRPPQPWLVSVLSGAVSRARNWVWRGHWAWSPPRLRSLSLPRAKAAPGTVWLRPVAVLAGVAFIATITLAVPPLRQAIVQVSNNLTGSQQSGGGGTDGNGSPSGSGGGGTLSTGARSTASAGASGSQGAGSRGPVTTTRCQPTAAATATASGSALPLGAVESALPGTQPTACRTPSTSATQPASATSATPTPTSTTVTTPTPTATGTPTPTATPTVTTTPTTTPTPTDTGTASPSTSASDGATGVVGS
jgi:hypothetical protein